MMIVPIIMEDKVIGTIGIDEITNKRRFTDDEAQLAQAIADQVAIAISNSKLIQQITLRVRKLLKSLHEVGIELTSLSDKHEYLDDILKRIAKSAHSVLRADLVDLYQFNQNRDEFVLPPIREGKLFKPEFVPKDVLKRRYSIYNYRTQ